MTASETLAAVDAIEARIGEIAASHGLMITRSDRSRISCSRYISVDFPNARGFDAGKSARSRYVAEFGSFPRFSSLNVRVSDHHGYGDGTIVHRAVRVERAEVGLAALDRALALLVEISR